MKSLQWVRGWVSESAVQLEYNELERYKLKFYSCIHCQANQLICEHSNTFIEKLKLLRKKNALRPLIFLTLVSLFTTGNGMLSSRPYMVQMFQTYGFPVEPQWASVNLIKDDVTEKL